MSIDYRGGTKQKMLKLLKGKKKKNRRINKKICLHNIEILEKYELPFKC